MRYMKKDTNDQRVDLECITDGSKDCIHVNCDPSCICKTNDSLS